MLVAFDASASADADGSITSYSWTFGDGDSATGLSTSHSYAAAGNYTASVVVTDDDGATATAARQIQVTEPAAQTLVVSGEIQILASSAVDTDVNDVLSVPNVSNNSASSAQMIPLPVSLGGFANLPGTGPTSGRLFASGDSSDFYAISAAGGERVVLDVGNHPGADLDLRLWDAGNVLVDASVGFNATETLVLPSAGDYFLEVVAVADASNYVLSVGLANQTSAPAGTADSSRAHTNAADPQVSTDQSRRATRLSDKFVAGEWLSTRQPQGPGAAHSHPALRTEQVSAVGAIERHRLTNPTLASNELMTRLTGGSATLRAQNAPSGQRPRSLPAPSVSTAMALKYATLLRVGELRRAGASSTEPNLLRTAHAIPNDTLYGAHWHYDAISLPLAWDVTTGSTAVIVAVIDTGVLVNHPDFAGKLTPGFDFISDASRAGDGDGIDPDPNDPGDAALAGASSFHGTHVAGTIGAATNNGTGVAGSGWDTRVMPLRVLGSEGGTSFDILQAVRFAAGLSNAANTLPPQTADIINLSLGGGLFSQLEQDTFTEVRNAGVLVFASAGNDSSSAPSYPAAYNGVVSVSATTINNTLADYSNFGTDIDLAAPGGNSGTDLNGDGIGDGVMSTLGDDSGAAISFDFGVLNGTSMSAPHAAGVAALMKAVHPNLSPAEFESALLSGQLTQDLGPPGRDDQFGAGLLNAQKAVLSAQALANGTSPDPGPILAGSVNRLNFGTFQTGFELLLSNAGTGSLVVNPASSDQPWLTATASATDAAGLGTYTLNVDRAGLANGTYTGRLTFASNSNSHRVDVLMQVSALDLVANAGTHFIILVDDAGNTVSQGLVNTPDQGRYAYTLSNVPPGSYRLFAGTDLDNDDFLCDAGEACGAFRTLDSPAVLVLSADRSDLDFLSGFRQNFGSNQNQAGTPERVTPVAPIGEQRLRIHKDRLATQREDI